MYAVISLRKPGSTGTVRPVYATTMDLNAVRDFLVVAEHGSYAEAGRVLGLPKSTLSRRVAALEQSLGVRLMERNSRRLRLTTEGDELRERATSLVTALADLEEQVRPLDALQQVLNLSPRKGSLVRQIMDEESRTLADFGKDLVL